MYSCLLGQDRASMGPPDPGMTPRKAECCGLIAKLDQVNDRRRRFRERLQI
jgi:hypothetical protein